MPSILIDYPQPDTEQPFSISGQDTDGTEFDEESFLIPVVIPLSEVGPWLGLYDPTSGTSPSAANSRIIARAVLDALKKIAETP